jgi:hypothetical protein
VLTSGPTGGFAPNVVGAPGVTGTVRWSCGSAATTGFEELAAAVLAFEVAAAPSAAAPINPADVAVAAKNSRRVFPRRCRDSFVELWVAMWPPLESVPRIVSSRRGLLHSLVCKIAPRSALR